MNIVFHQKFDRIQTAFGSEQNNKTFKNNNYLLKYFIKILIIYDIKVLKLKNPYELTKYQLPMQ